MAKCIMILQDGETYTGLDGCSIVSVPEEYDGDMIEDAIRRLNSERNAWFLDDNLRMVQVVTVFQDPA